MATFEKRVQTGADDGYSRSGSFSNSASTLISGPAAPLVFSWFVRIPNVNVLKDATVTNAYIQFTPSANDSTTVNFTIAGDDSVDPVAPTSVAEFDAIARTSQTVAWAAGGFTAEQAENTPDISAIIQHLVNKSDWHTGSAIQIVFDFGSASGAAIQVHAYDGAPAKAPLLHVEYIEPITEQINTLSFYLIPQPSTTIFTGRVDSAPASPYVSVDYNTGITGSFGAPIPGQSVWFGSTAGGKERGVRRLRSWSGGATGTIEIDESDDTGPLIQANDHITIKWDFRLWPKYPRFVQSGTEVTIFEDYDIAYTNQTIQWRPVANAGSVAVEFLEGGQAQVSFVGDKSFALAEGATLTSYLWTAYDSTEGTSTSQGTEASPVIFTWTAPGWHLVSLQVTDSNGQTHTNYTWAIIIDPANPENVAFLDFDNISDSFDFEQGGGECSFVVRGDASISEFPEEALIVHACRGDLTTPTGVWPNRQNTLFVGWILSDSIRQNPFSGDVSFRAGTIDAIMRNLSMFPVSLTDRNTPVDWTQAKNLNVDRAASFLWKYRSTLDIMTPIIPSDFTGLIQRQDFSPTNLYSQLQNELISSILGQVVSSHQGVLYHTIKYNLRNSPERATVDTRKTLHKGVWVDNVTIEEITDYVQPANQVKMSGIFYPGGEVSDICPAFSEAPGDAMKVYGSESNFDRLIILSQSDLNTRCGHALADLNEQYPGYIMRFINDGAFTTVPQELFPAIIESGDNDRAIAFNGNLIPQRINRSYDHVGGYFFIDVSFKPETSGVAGVTVDLPCGPPDQKLPNTVTPDPPAGIPSQTALIASTTGSSFYFAPGLDQTWEARVNDLTSDELGIRAIDPDPWTTFKQGYNIETQIVWASGKGFLVRTENTGNNWGRRSSYLEPPPAWSGETGTPTSSIDFLRLSTDIFIEDRLFVLASWQYTGGYHGAVAKTDDGFSFDWFNVTGSEQVRPLGMSLDRGNGGKLYITTWERDSDPTGTIFLRQYNTSDMSLAGKFSLGAATVSDIDSQVYYANPFNRLGQSNEVFVYGRMNNPQVNSGTVHVMLNTNCGATGAYSVIEQSWGADVCGAFGADFDGYYYAVRNV